MLLARGNIDEALVQLNNHQKITGNNDERLNLGIAAAHMMQQEFASAKKILDELINDGVNQPAAYLLVAELNAYAGQPDEAFQYGQRAIKEFPKNAKATSALANIKMLAGEIEESITLANEALSIDQNSTDAWIVKGKLAYLDGEFELAEEAFREAIRINPHEDRGWYGLGIIYSDIEFVRRARQYLNKAIVQNPKGPGYRGALGSLLAAANDLEQADQEFNIAINDNQNDAVSIAGQGLLHLKRGNTEQALDSFIKAQLIQPEYARAYLYAAVAYYQLGDIENARDSIAKAKQHDPNDPLPGFIASIINQDMFEAKSARGEALEAYKLLPNLRSLNQLLSDRKGTTNLASAFAFSGMEEWALSLGQESFYPYWAGSHLFLSDRYAQPYLEDSELLNGFITDPLSIGASNRFQSVYQKPGNYVTSRLNGSVGDDSDAFGSGITLNGLSNKKIPFAYFLEGNGSRNRIDIVEKGRGDFAEFTKVDEFEVDNYNFTSGFGLQPFYELNLFASAIYTAEEFEVTTLTDTLSAFITSASKSVGPDDRDIDVYDGNHYDMRFDAGMHYKISPENNLWLSIQFSESNLDSFRTVDRVISTDFFGLSVDISANSLSQSDEFQVNRYNLSIKNIISINDWITLTSGAGATLTEANDTFTAFGRGKFINPFDRGIQVQTDVFITKQDTNARLVSLEVYSLADFDILESLKLQAGLFLFHADDEFSFVDFFFDKFEDNVFPETNFSGSSTFKFDSEQDFLEWNPRIGLTYEFNPGQLLRLAFQRWSRPDNKATLLPVATSGIPLETRFNAPHGTSEQYRIQSDWRFTDFLYATIFAERLFIDNTTGIGGLSSGEAFLKPLRNKINSSTENENLLTAGPEFGKNVIESLGLNIDFALFDEFTGGITYVYRRSESNHFNLLDSSDFPEGNFDMKVADNVLGIPTHTISIGATWISPKRFTVDTNILYQSRRLFNRFDGEVVEPSWELRMRGFWESMKKGIAINAKLNWLIEGKEKVTPHFPFSTQFGRVQKAPKFNASLEFVYRY